MSLPPRGHRFSGAPAAGPAGERGARGPLRAGVWAAKRLKLPTSCCGACALVTVPPPGRAASAHSAHGLACREPSPACWPVPSQAQRAPPDVLRCALPLGPDMRNVWYQHAAIVGGEQGPLPAGCCGFRGKDTCPYEVQRMVCGVRNPRWPSAWPCGFSDAIEPCRSFTPLPEE